VLERRRPPAEIYRIGRSPDPWQAPDWSRANADGTFGNRFDDPHGFYRVVYASSQRLSCFLETLARFRPDLSLIAELREIEGEDDFLPIGIVPREWCDDRLLGTASASGEYADLYASAWVGLLRRELAEECLRLGVQDLDAGILQRDRPRRLTQLASAQVYQRGFSGIYYRSRHGHNLENWALFEPFLIASLKSRTISDDDPNLLQALGILGLRLG
jgi:hypothetical protein